MSVNGEYPNGLQVEPNYFLDPEELASLEAEVVERTAEQFPDQVVAAWINPLHPYANISRTHEASYFPEVADLDPEYDAAQEILLLIDTREGQKRVVHAATTTRLSDVSDEEVIEANRTGIYTIDSLIELGNFSAADFLGYYAAQGIDLRKSLCAETNFRIHPDDPMPPYNYLNSAQLAYLELYSKLIREDSEVGRTIVIATANSKQVRSLQRNGFATEPLLGRDTFTTEEEELGVVSKPLVIPIDENFKNLMDLIGFKLPVVEY